MFKLILDKQVEKYIKKLDAQTRERIVKALLSLSENPYNEPHIKRLKGKDDLYRKRVGDYRIIFKIKDNHMVILVLKVGSRGDVYND